MSIGTFFANTNAFVADSATKINYFNQSAMLLTANFGRLEMVDTKKAESHSVVLIF